MGERAKTSPRWLNKSVVGFGLASFLSDAGHEAATSALPSLLTALGAPPAALGLIEGIADAASSVAKLVGGFWADRPSRRKPIAVAGYLITGLSTGCYGLASGWSSVLLARSTGWLARGIRGPARDAMLSEAVPPDAVGRAFGFHRACDTGGAVIGPLLASVLIAFLPLRSIFAVSLIPGVLASVAFALFVQSQSTQHTTSRRFRESLRALPIEFRRFLGAVFLFGLGDFARTLLILRATQLLAPTRGDSAASLAIVLYAAHNAIYALASFPVGALADRIPSQPLLGIGYGLGALTAFLAAISTDSLATLTLLFAVAGLTLAFVDTLEGTVTARLVQADLRGTAYGALATTNGVGDLVSSSLIGILWTAFGPESAFLVASVLCLVGATAIALNRRKTREA